MELQKRQQQLPCNAHRAEALYQQANPDGGVDFGLLCVFQPNSVQLVSFAEPR
jgi:hypothetical protein